MSNKENLKSLFKSNQSAVKKLLDDITEEESLNPTRGLCNHIKWQVGHLAYCVDYMIELLGGEKSLSDDWIAPYKGGVEISKDNSVYPPYDELRGKLYELYDKMNSTLENVSEDIFDEIISDDWKETRINALLFFCTHEFYHAGHITIARKNLGRERPFG